MPPSLNFNQLKDLAKGMVGIPDIKTTKNFTKGCAILIVMGVALLVAAISPIYGQHNIDLRTRELSPNARGGSTFGGPVVTEISGPCGDLQNASAMTADQIQQFIEKAWTDRGRGSRIGELKDVGRVLSAAALKYNVNPAVVLAIGGQDSGFATAGVGERAKNPGNIKGASSGTSPADQAILDRLADDFRKEGFNAIKGRGEGNPLHLIFATYADGWGAMAYNLGKPGSRYRSALQKNSLADLLAIWINGNTSSPVSADKVNTTLGFMKKACEF